MSVVKNKTASLIATAGQFGGMLSGAPDEVTAGSRPPARRWVSRSSCPTTSSTSPVIRRSLGKAPGTDLREGVQTLPMLHALRSADPAGARLTELLSVGRAH